jgi:2-oxoglutarate dehydrogenase E2 component (dihydrolipoamide succinyltransferase)
MTAIVEIKMPALQEGTESVVAGWLKKAGETVNQHEPIVEINTDKAITEVAAPATGILAEVIKQPDQKVEPGDVLGRIQVGGAPMKVPASEQPAHRASARLPERPAAASRDLSPAVRSLIKQHNLDVALLRGSGRNGRITHEDVLDYLKNASGAKPSSGSPNRKIPHTPTRRRIAQHMVQSMLHTAPHVTAVFDVDLSAVAEHRNANKAEFDKRGVRLTYTSYFVAAAVNALKAVPEVNSRWHEDALEVFGDCNIGVAVAAEGGLIVPVIQRAQTLDLLGIAATLQELTEKARHNRLALSELQGGTFTITNHGVSGSLIATPIINQPQSAILGVGKVEKRVTVTEVDGVESIQVRPMAYVTLTIDHRALDGFQANTFLGHFTAALKAY